MRPRFTISLERSTLIFSYPQAGRPITPSLGVTGLVQKLTLCPASTQTHFIRDRCEYLSQPPNVSSAAPRVPAPASPRTTSKRHRNKQVLMLAAGADSRVLARLAAAQQLDRRSAAGTLPAPGRGRKSQPG